MQNSQPIKLRIFKSRLLFVSVCVCSAITAIPLLAILGEVLVKGWHQLGWSFLTEATPNAYKAMMAAAQGESLPGGIAGGIVGTFLMLLTASVAAIPTGILCGIFLVENLSVILQRYYYKAGKRKGVKQRLFKRAPIHDHFRTSMSIVEEGCSVVFTKPEQLFHESKITVRFWIITIILAAITIITLKIR